MRSVLVMLVIVVLAAGMVGCGTSSTPAGDPPTGGQATATPLIAPTEVATTAPATAAPVAATTAATAAAPAATTAPSGAGGQTAGALAQAGQGVYTQSCAMCHGENGEGTSAPAVWGTGANLAKYNTGQGLYDYVHKGMPLSAPGSLTDQQYLQVVTYLLLQNKDVEANAAVDQSGLGQIQLK